MAIPKSGKPVEHELVEFVRTCPLTGKEIRKRFKVSLIRLDMWERKMLSVDYAFPHLSEADREFIRVRTV